MQLRNGSFSGDGGLQLFHRCWRPDGPARAVLLCVHGVQDHADRWQPVGEHLAPKGYAVYAFDARGHGRSLGQRGHVLHWQEYLNDAGTFRQLAAAAEPGLPVYLMGHSMGGLVVLHYGLRYPDGLAGVIAVSPGLLSIRPALKTTLARLVSGVAPRFSLVQQFELAQITRDPVMIQAMRQDKLRHNKLSARWGTEFFAAQDWTNAHAGQWRLPLLMLLGDADPICFPAGGRRFFDAAPVTDKDCVFYPGGMHMPFDDTCRATALADLQRWLDTHTG